MDRRIKCVRSEDLSVLYWAPEFYRNYTALLQHLGVTGRGTGRGVEQGAVWRVPSTPGWRSTGNAEGVNVRVL